MYSNYSDETLVKITLLGDENAYATLVKKYEACVIRTAMSITGNRYLAEDAAQDAFVSAWIKLNTLKDPSKFSSWIQRIIVNCAKNLAVRYRDYISLDKIENYDFGVVLPYENIEESEVKNSVSGLSEKVKQVVELHYFHDMSIADIAEKLRLPVGTVKRRLYDGRNKLRKDLGYMNDEGKTLLEAVIQRVEALKMWRVRNSKEGFEQVYNELIIDIDKLPESKEKYFAKAETLMQGFWWLDNNKNDEFIEQMRESAEKGNNTTVLAELIRREENKVPKEEKLKFMLEKQMPKIEKLGDKNELAREWFWIGYYYAQEKDFDNCIKSYKKVLELADPSYVYYANALSAIKLETNTKGKDKRLFGGTADGEVYKIQDGKLVFYSQPGYSNGHFFYNYSCDAITYFSSRCDGIFYDENMKVGDIIYSTDRISTLKYEANDAVVDTKCGRFENCDVFCTKYNRAVYKTYYKRGVGIVMFELLTGGFGDKTVLRSFKINGGSGLIPFAKGNHWTYEFCGRGSFKTELTYDITAFDGETITASVYSLAENAGYDFDNWDDMVRAYRQCYFIGEYDDCQLCDVSKYMLRAKELAKTDFEITYTDISTRVMQRIFDTDPKFNKDTKVLGRWNFFTTNNIIDYDGEIKQYLDNRFRFEWKNTDGSSGDVYYLLNNFVYESLQNNCGCLFSDKWVVGEKLKMHGRDYDNTMTDVEVKDAGAVTTPAGTFENCIKVEINAVARKWWYMVGRKDYYFAPGVGLIRYVSHYDHIKDLNYDLTSYVGTGDGYFPIDEGMSRTFEAQGAPENIIGKVEYTYIKDDNGQMIILADQTGVEIL